jgi:hypothetical protein
MTEGHYQTAPSDQRREARQSPSPSYQGEVLLRNGRTRVEAPVVALRNYSPAGASVLTRLEYQSGDLVSLILFSEGVRMEFFGCVAWCRAASDAENGDGDLQCGTLLFLVGLQMRGPVSLAAALKARPKTLATSEHAVS